MIETMMWNALFAYIAPNALAFRALLEILLGPLLMQNPHDSTKKTNNEESKNTKVVYCQRTLYVNTNIEHFYDKSTISFAI